MNSASLVNKLRVALKEYFQVLVVLSSDVVV